MTALRSLTALAAVLLLVGLGVSQASAAPEAGIAGDQGAGDQGFLAGLISSLLSSADAKVSIGAVEGGLSADATVRDIVIADRQGPWFHLDRVRLVWNRSALFARRLDVERLEIGKIEVARKPVAALPTAETAAAPAASTTPGPSVSLHVLLPDLPLKVVVKAFSLGELSLGEPVLGVAARLTASGSVSLGKPSEGLHLAFQTRRLDAPGLVALALSFVPETQALDI